MTGDVHDIGDWAAAIAEQFMGDIPRSVPVAAPSGIADRIAAYLRLALVEARTPREINMFVDGVIFELPRYIPEQTTSRLRAKLIGALMTASAVGGHLKAHGVGHFPAPNDFDSAGVTPGGDDA